MSNIIDVIEFDWNGMERGSDGSLASVHRIRYKNGYRFPLHRHRGFYELVVCLDGSLTHSSGTRTWKQKAGDILLVRDGDCHSLSGRQGEFINVVLPTLWLKDLELENFGALQSGVAAVLSAAEQEEIKAGFEEYAGASVDWLKRLRYTRLILGLMEAVLSPTSRFPLTEGFYRGKQGGGTPAWFTVALRSVDTGVWKPRSAGGLAAAAGVSPEHLSREWKRRTGLNPSAYLRQVRLDRALGMLGSTNLSVTDIALGCGFQSINYFFVKFRERYGKSPGEYRRGLRRGMVT